MGCNKKDFFSSEELGEAIIAEKPLAFSIVFNSPATVFATVVLSALSAIDESSHPSLKLKAKSLFAKKLNVVTRYGFFGFGRYIGVTSSTEFLSATTLLVEPF